MLARSGGVMIGADERQRPAMRVAALLVLLCVAASTLLGACEEAGASAGPGESLGSSQLGGGGSGVAPGGGAGIMTSFLEAQIAALRDGTRTERADAAKALGQLGDRAAVPALITALGDESWTVREGAATALGVLRDPAAIDALLALIAVEPSQAATDDAAAVGACDAAVTALGLLGDTRAVPRLVAIALDDGTALDRAGAEAAIVEIGPGAVAGIATALTRASSGNAAMLAQLIARFGDPGFGPLVKALSNKSTAVRVAAATALDAYGARAGKPLIVALGDRTTAVRVAAAHSLGVIGATGPTAALVKLLSTRATRNAAVNALVAIHRDNATPLVKYLRSRATVMVYRPLIRIGQANTVSALVKAIRSFGDKTMGETYLNCGNPTLEKAARAWGTAHGYVVVPSGGVDGESWGAH